MPYYSKYLTWTSKLYLSKAPMMLTYSGSIFSIVITLSIFI